MKLKSVYSSLFVIMALVSSGCDKVCKTTVNDVVTVQNLTGKEWKVNYCRGRAYGIHEVTIKADQNGQLSLGERDDTYVRGGSDQCEKDSETRPMGIALTKRNFSQVKFCYADKAGTHIYVVEPHQACPTGTEAQTQPVDDCTF